MANSSQTNNNHIMNNNNENQIQKEDIELGIKILKDMIVAGIITEEDGPLQEVQIAKGKLVFQVNYNSNEITYLKEGI